MNQSLVSLTQILLCRRICRVEAVNHIRFLIPYRSTGNRLAFGVVDEPILMVFVDPRPTRYLEGGRPYAEDQAISDNSVAYESHAIREQCGIGCGVFSTRVLIALIHLEILVAEWLQMFGLPVRVCQGLAFIDGAVESRPAPPTDRSFKGDSGVVQASNCIAIRQQLTVVVQSGLEHQAFGFHLFSGFDRKTEFDLIHRRVALKIELLLNLRRSRGVSGERSNFRVASRARTLQMKQGQESIGGQRAQEKAFSTFSVVDELASRTAMHPTRRLSQVVDL